MSDQFGDPMAAQSQGDGLDPQEFLPMQMPLQQAPPAPPDVSQYDDSLEPDKVGKRESDKIFKEMKERFDRCVAWESRARSNNLEDFKFIEGDAYNNFQWPATSSLDAQVGSGLDQTDKPMLTINRSKQHVHQITNDQKQNAIEIKYRPAGGGATYDSAQIFQGLARHVMSQSNFEAVQSTAVEQQVKMGLAYWRVCTRYVDEDSFDQEIYIEPVRDRFSVYLDPDILQFDGSDARFGFVYSDVPRSLLLSEHPEWEKYLSESSGLGGSFDNTWVDKDTVRQVEYFRLSERQDELISWIGADGQRQSARASQLGETVVSQLKGDPETKVRSITTNDCEWHLLVGSRVVLKRKWPGRYIPLVRVVGEETVIDGIWDVKGHVRQIIDPQRNYNYWASSAVENVALQSKTPYLVADESVEGYENIWSEANTKNYAMLPYKAFSEDGRPIPPPTRAGAVDFPEAYLRGLQTASMDLMAVTGQYQSQLGQQGNEVSGKAINERQRQGDNANFHFIFNLGVAVRYTGVILADLFPKIYDAERTIRIMAQDGTESAVQIDPTMAQASQPMVDPSVGQEQMTRLRRAGEVEHALNPKVGRYEVYADIGPAYATQRQETWNALSQIITTNESLVGIIGDIALKAADFPMADEAADRLRRMVPAQALGDAPPPEVLELQQQVQNLTASLTTAIQALADKAAETKVDQEKLQIDVYKAETDRLQKLMKNEVDRFKEGMPDTEHLRIMIQEAVISALTTTLDSTKRTVEAFLETPEVPPNVANELGQEEPSPLDLSAAGVQQPLPQVPDNSVVPGPGGSVVSDAGGPVEAVQGMRQAPDGHFYIPDPSRPGKYMRVGG